MLRGSTAGDRLPSLRRRQTPAAERGRELHPELLAHAAVDDEVERIADGDEHVDEQRGYLASLGIY